MADAPILVVGPTTRGLLDPQSLVEAKITARARIVTRATTESVVDAARIAALDVSSLQARISELATNALFEALMLRARMASCSLSDVLAPAFRRDMEAAFLRAVQAPLGEAGLVVVRIDGLELAMDAKTQAWLRARRSSSRAVVAAEKIDEQGASEATEVAGTCQKCGAQVAPDAIACPTCGGSIAPPAACARCSAELRPGSRFCASCGAPAARKCSRCRSVIEDDARFCALCGSRA